MPLTTWLVVSKAGNCKHISAYTESDARQQAVEFCGDDGISEFRVV